MPKRKANCIGVLTAGGDCPGLNAAIRGVGKAATDLGIEVVGIYDGFRGLVENRFRILSGDDFSGILATGGTVLGTSRDKPQRMRIGSGQEVDMTEAAVQNYARLHLDCLVCLGGNGTQKNALQLMKAGGLRVVTIPKTIDNDVAGTDVSFGYDTALSIATGAIDRLHSTAESHRRVMVVELMGHKTGWLTLGAGIAGGADVILIPEIPYDVDKVCESVIARDRRGKRFSIIAVAEGARPAGAAGQPAGADKGKSKKGRVKGEAKTPPGGEVIPGAAAACVADALQARTGLEVRVTVLGHVQRGGVPTPQDRLLATRLGARASELIAEGTTGVMVAVRGEACEPVPLEEVAGRTRLVAPDDPLVQTARRIGVCMGDEVAGG
jgi:ATP-dependent phosphofructokinase / diphosphate-dependent phosphofructokinase